MPGTNLKKFSYRQLDHAINKRAVSFKRNLRVLIPYLRAMRKLLRDPGKRNDLPNAETLPTWTEWKESKRRTLGLAPRTIDLLLETGSTSSKTRSKTGGKNRTSGTSAGGRTNKPALLKVADYRDWLVFLIAKVEKRASECHAEIVHWAGEAKAFIEDGELALRGETGAPEPAASVLLLPPTGSKVLWHGEEWELDVPLVENAKPDEHGNRRLPIFLRQTVPSKLSNGSVRKVA
jgi:hypothetical protein